jgi:hypothetical protein
MYPIKGARGEQLYRIGNNTLGRVLCVAFKHGEAAISTAFDKRCDREFSEKESHLYGKGRRAEERVRL